MRSAQQKEAVSEFGERVLVLAVLSTFSSDSPRFNHPIIVYMGARKHR